jgi:integrase
MNTQNLKEQYPLLINYLRESEYTKTYVDEFLFVIRRVLREACNPEIKSYEEYYESLATSKRYAKSTLRNKRKIIGQIKQFDLNGIYPSPGHHYKLIGNEKYDCLSLEFKKIIDTFVKSATERGITNSSIIRLKISAVAFLLYLQNHGSSSLLDISENHVQQYFHDGKKMIRGYSVLKPIRAVFKECIPFYQNNECEVILSFLPLMKDTHKVYPYLEDDEIDKINLILLNTDCTNVSLRDRAIVTIAFYTGLRACDIAALTFDNIDWNNNLIQITQRKTGVPLTLPLRPVVGNIIWKYIEKERPETNADNQTLFLTIDKKPRRLSRATMYDVAETILTKAGVRVNNGRKGTHIFRYRLAVSLLRSGIQSSIISNVLGHTYPESIESYLETDINSLKKCALSIEKYNMGKEGF